jgi:hypothetical protein
MLRYVHRVSNANPTHVVGYPFASAPYIGRFAPFHHKPTDGSASSRAQVISTPTPGIIEAKKAIREARQRFKKYHGYCSDAEIQQKLDDWNKLGPPPLSEYRLTFGKHWGMKLDEVPLSYLAKYLIPRRPTSDCPIVGEAIDDYMARNPDVKSQAGRKKMQPVKVGKDIK